MFRYHCNVMTFFFIPNLELNVYSLNITCSVCTILLKCDNNKKNTHESFRHLSLTGERKKKFKVKRKIRKKKLIKNRYIETQVEKNLIRIRSGYKQKKVYFQYTIIFLVYKFECNCKTGYRNGEFYFSLWLNIS